MASLRPPRNRHVRSGPVAPGYRNLLGFTLIEVLLTIALIGIFGGLAVIQFPRMIEAFRDPDPVDAVIEALREARLHTLRSGESLQVSLSIDPDSGAVTLSGLSPTRPASPIPLPDLIAELEFLPDPVYIDRNRAPDPTLVAEIAPTGRYGFGGFRLTTTDGTRIEVALNPMGGFVPDSSTTAE